MSFTIEGYGDHPVAVFLHSVNGDAAKLADSPLWSLSDAEVDDLLTTAAQAEAQVAALKLRLVAEADGRAWPLVRAHRRPKRGCGSSFGPHHRWRPDRSGWRPRWNAFRPLHRHWARGD